MKNTILKSSLALALAFAGINTASAATASDQFDVTITITNECTIVANDLPFGSHGGQINANIDQASTMVVNCNPGAVYEVALDAGDGSGSTVASRFMDDGGTNTVAYQMYRDASRSQIWGETSGVDTVGGTGTGANQTLNLYGRVPSGQSVASGSYISTVSATVTF